MTDPIHALTVTTRGEREIVITRVFAAPRERVFEALTRADLLQRWLSGPPGWAMVACESDARPGGTFRHAWRNDDGREMAMHGVYREVEPPERMVRTETFDHGCESQAGEQVATLVLSQEQDGAATLATITLAFPSREARDGVIASGVGQGLETSYARLEELAGELARQ